MAVNDYLRECKYNLNNLDNYIYLCEFNEPILDYITDDGVSNGTSTSLKVASKRLYCESVSYQSTSSVDNRFSFENTLTVTLSESKDVTNYSIIKELITNNWMVVFKNIDGDAFVMNAEFPVMVSYNYTFNDEKTPNNLTITFRALQNVPTINLRGSVMFSSTLRDKPCEYNISRIESLKMIDMTKADISVNSNGFNLIQNGIDSLKTIEFNPTSLSFVDSYDGREFSQQLTFSIPFDSYRFYFHYNLLEYIDNRYYALIETTNGNNILGGFRQGLFPSYTISTSDSGNLITFTLTARYTTYSVLGTDTMNIIINNNFYYVPVLGECVNNIYTYTLIERINQNGVSTNGYYCLNGFEEVYDNYTILGTYNQFDTKFGINLTDFNIDCSEGCKINGLPSSIQFTTSGETKCYDLDATCSVIWEWNNEAISVDYDDINKRLCVTSIANSGTFSIKAISTNGAIQYVTVVIGSGGITGDTTTTINITAEGQIVSVIPIKGLNNVKSVTSTLQYVINQNNNGYNVTVSENPNEEPRTFTITIVYNDNSIETINIIQDRIYYKIVSSEETECFGNDLYYVNKRYKGYSETNINIFVENIKGNVKENDSESCFEYDEKVSACTSCFEGYIYTLYEYKKDDVVVVTKYEKTTETCVNNGSTQYQINEGKTVCINDTPYYKEDLFGLNCKDNSTYIRLYPNIEKVSETEAPNSNICDVIDPNASENAKYRWVDTDETYCLNSTQEINCTSSTTTNYCDGYNQYQLTTLYIDPLCNGDWVENGVTKTLIETNSTECGYEEGVSIANLLDFTNGEVSTYNLRSLSNETFTGEYSINGKTFNAVGNRTIKTLSDLGFDKLTSCKRGFRNSNINDLISYFDTKDVMDMSDMFGGCSNLRNLNISYFDTSNVIDMNDMFIACSGLTSLDLSNFNTSRVTNMRNMFNNCSALTSVDISNFDTRKVRDIRGMFSGCQRLRNLNLTNFNTSNITSLNNMFTFCTDLSSLDLSSFDTSNVTSMFQTFAMCENLTSLDLSSWNTSKVTDMGGMFTNCKNLTSLNVTGWDISNVTNYDYMFSYCTKLSNLILGEVDDDIYNWWCARLTESNLNCNIIKGANKDVFKITYAAKTYNENNGERTFYFNQIGFNTLSTGTLTTNDDNTYTYEVNIYEENNISNPITQLTSLNNFYNLETTATIEKMPDTSNVTDMSYMFSCFNSNVILNFNPSSINTSNVKTMGRNFYGYKANGDYLDLRSWDVSKVTTFANSDFNSIFSFCSTKKIDVRGWKFDLIRSYKWLFSYFNGEEILQDFDTSNITDMSYMFNYCSGLTSLDLSNFNTSNVTNMSYMFSNCSNLTLLDVSSWDISNSSSYLSMFRNCTSLTKLLIKEGTMSWWCQRLTESNISCDIIQIASGGGNSGIE